MTYTHEVSRTVLVDADDEFAVFNAIKGDGSLPHRIHWPADETVTGPVEIETCLLLGEVMA